ncbi:MAG: hypothetical protein C4321_09050, partial [Chloroflexota bacterium]
MEYSGKPLKMGADNDPAAVKAIQARLGVQQTGVFGPTTRKCVCQFQALHRDQNGQPLVVDGEV